MERFSIRTHKRCEFIPIEDRIQELAAQAGMQSGVAQVFVPHTTAGVTINENADPDVVADMEQALDRVVPWKNNYAHAEGNTAAHVKASLMGSSATVFINRAGSNSARGKPCISANSTDRASGRFGCGSGRTPHSYSTTDGRG